MKIIRAMFRKLKCDDRGQALIELAISIPLLMLLLLGATELGRLAYAAIEVSNAAKAAAQFASYGGAYSATSASGFDELGMLTAAKADAGELSSMTFASGYPTMSCSCSGASGSAKCGSGNIPPTGCNPPSSTVEVTVKVRTQTVYNPFIFIPGWSHSGITLYGYAEQKVLPL
jgi:Flp pilus assembly protein TadG